MPVTGNPTIRGGVSHNSSTLSQAERQAAYNALAKLKSTGGSPGSPWAGSSPSATMFGGSSLKVAGLGTPTLIGGQGNDTFAGGARGAATNPFSAVGNDTVVSGSTATFGGRASGPENVGARGIQNFSLSSDTINAAGVTAVSVKTAHPQDAANNAHKITLADKTTITIAGLSPHDISNLQH